MPGCSCIYVDVYDDGGPEAFREVSPKARKTHRCHECDREIAVGEIYRKESGIWEGRPDSYKTCSDCISIREAFFCEGFFYGMIHDSLFEHLNNAGGQVSSECLEKLTPRAKDVVFKMMDRVFGVGEG